MLEELFDLCAQQEVGKVLLDVRESNAAARSLYEHAGFKEDGVRQKFYENPVEDAILMSRPTGK